MKVGDKIIRENHDSPHPPFSFLSTINVVEDHRRAKKNSLEHRCPGDELALLPLKGLLQKPFFGLLSKFALGLLCVLICGFVVAAVLVRLTEDFIMILVHCHKHLEARMWTEEKVYQQKRVSFPDHLA